MQDDNILLNVEKLVKYFPVKTGAVIQRHVADVKAVDDISFFIRRGETLGMVGESGCGKTTTGRCILQLYKPTSGQVLFEGQDLTTLSSKGMRAMRREMQVIFQDPYSSLNPRMTAGNIIGEPLIVHGLVDSKQEYREKVADLLQNVGLNPYMADRFPHEFSGGQRQRIALARALLRDPDIVILDEATSALDSLIEQSVADAIKRRLVGHTLIVIAHRLSTIRDADLILVFESGRIVERGTWSELIERRGAFHSLCLAQSEKDAAVGA